MANLLVQKFEEVEGVSTVRAYMDDNGITLDNVEEMLPIKNWIELYVAATSTELNVPKSKKPERMFQKWEDVAIGKRTEYLGLWLSNDYDLKKIWMNPLVKITVVVTRIKNIKCSLANKIQLVNSHIAFLFDYVGKFFIIPNSVTQIYFRTVKKALGIHRSLSVASMVNPFSAFSM